MILCSSRTVFVFTFLLLFCLIESKAQVAGYTGTVLTEKIQTAVPFLLISPDARSGAMGDAGVATSPDVNSIHWNPSKIAFAISKSAISLSYTPWLQQLAPDIYMAYLSGYYKTNSRNTIGLSFKYFSMGEIELRDASSAANGTYNPSDFSIDGTFARSFGNSLSLATTFRFIYSKIASDVLVNSQQSSAGTAFAADLSAYYKKEIQLAGKPSDLAFGINLSNIGNKLSYLNDDNKQFLPTNLKIGSALTLHPDSQNQLTLALDFNKLLVPTPPQTDAEGNISAGRSNDRSVASGIFGSFSDAPGSFSEELKEISMGAGLEYLFDQKFALRTGYYYENPYKGERRYLTMGAGFKYSQLNLDFSYLLASIQRSPLANSLRFSLMYAIK
ncbi:type IX secretion system outer membrane channel protein PorV [Arcticibacter eurypsychrophilus]|uniref:type IX secretion system outer membrane channel protein PorV n=1 Tax=Arcticibacter eurypsychrophilus TaxID=1434752 RepID=UPI000AF59365|nr:type IX secretion system outer membrane channel protein PorV [Arcticibacter eurypsychrophilus]